MEMHVSGSAARKDFEESCVPPIRQEGHAPRAFCLGLGNIRDVWSRLQERYCFQANEIVFISVVLSTCTLY